MNCDNENPSPEVGGTGASSPSEPSHMLFFLSITRTEEQTGAFKEEFLQNPEAESLQNENQVLR